MGIITNNGLDKDSKHKARATRYQKEKNNFSRAIDIIDHFDIAPNAGFRNDKKVKKSQINYGLMEGFLDVELYDDPLCFEVKGEHITLDYQSVSHYPLISQVAKTIIGEQTNRAFKPMIKDNTPDRQTYYKKEFNQRIQQHIQGSLQQQRQAVTQQLLQQSGITDMYSLMPEQQMELANQVEATMQKQTPEEIMEYMQYEFQTPTAKQAQKMLDFLIEYHDIKWKDTQGFKHAVVMAEEYYYVGERNGDIVFEVVPPTFFDWGGSMENEWSQHGSWAKRETWLSYQDITQKHAQYLSEKDLKELDYYHEPIGGMARGQDIFDSNHNRMVQYEYGRRPDLQKKYAGTNIKTTEGQKKFMNIYDDIYNTDLFDKQKGNGIIGANAFGIREAHIVWRDKRILKKVRREIDGKLKTFYLDEHYTEQPEDYDIKKIWVDEIWEGWKLGTYEAKYVNVRPVPYQYKSLDNPYNVDLPYYGKKYNVNNGITHNGSLIDLGKTFNKDFDIAMAQIKRDMATNYGKKLLMMFNLKPEDWKMQDWMDTIIHSPFIPIDVHKKGINAFDPQFVKQVDLSKMADIAAQIQLTQFYRDGVASSMYFNNGRIGALGQYANSTNIQTNQNASYNQTALFFESHRMVVEKALQGLLNYARFFYKDPENIDKARVFLDDVSMAELEIGPHTSYERMGVTLSNSPAELQKISVLKQQALTLIQNGSNPEGVLQMILADTETEVQDIIKKESKKIEQQRAEAQKIQQEQFQAQLQQKAEAEQRESEMKYLMHKEKIQGDIDRTIIDSQKFKNQMDVNMNQQNDLLESKILELETKLRIHDDEMLLEREKLELKEKLGKST